MSKIDFTSKLVLFKNDQGFLTTSIDGKNKEDEYVRKYVDVRFTKGSGWEKEDIREIVNGDIIDCEGFVSLSIGKDGESYVALIITKGDYIGNVFEEKEKKETAKQATKKTATKKTSKK